MGLCDCQNAHFERDMCVLPVQGLAMTTLTRYYFCRHIVDDANPLIVYDQWWTDTLQSDPDWTSYANHTFHATSHYVCRYAMTVHGYDAHKDS